MRDSMKKIEKEEEFDEEDVIDLEVMWYKWLNILYSEKTEENWTSFYFLHNI